MTKSAADDCAKHPGHEVPTVSISMLKTSLPCHYGVNCHQVTVQVENATVSQCWKVKNAIFLCVGHEAYEGCKADVHV